MIPGSKILIVITYIALFVFSLCTILWSVSHLPQPFNYYGVAMVVVFANYAAIFLLDMMIPGVNILSNAPTHLNNGNVALTFDDGPVEPFTRQILEILDQHQVKATFFCLGQNVEKNPQIAKEIIQKGHALGTHTYSHRSLPFLSKVKIQTEIQQGLDVAEKITGVRPTLFRCPKGYKSRKVLKISESLGQKTFGFSYPLFDVENPPAQEIINRVRNKISAGDILLMHDGFSSYKPGNRSSLVEALPGILNEIKKRNLKTVRLDQI